MAGTEGVPGRVVPLLADHAPAQGPVVADHVAGYSREDEGRLRAGRGGAEHVGVGVVEAHGGALDPGQVGGLAAAGREPAATQSVGRVERLTARSVWATFPEVDPAVLHDPRPFGRVADVH